jgi:hypothetical protein
VGGDSIFAMAYAGELTVNPVVSSLSLDFNMKSAPANKNATPSPGSLMVLSRAQGDAEYQRMSAVMTLMSGLSETKESAAQSVDRIMETVFTDPKTGQAPSYKGKFPRAIRTHSKRKQSSDTSEWSGWPGDEVQASWVCRIGRDSQSMVLAFGPRGLDTSRRVRWIVEAADKLDAIGGSNNEPTVIARGFILPDQAGPLLFEEDTGILSVLSAELSRVSWDVHRAPFGMRGVIEMVKSHNSKQSLLGN